MTLDDLERLARGAREALFDGADWAATMGSHDDVALHNAAWSPDRALAFIALARAAEQALNFKFVETQASAKSALAVTAHRQLRAALAAVTGPAAGGEK